jgi:FHS family L-fucose permease-like MFS transporter
LPETEGRLPLETMTADPASLQPTIATRLFGMLIGVYFSGGFLTAMISLLVPRLEILLGLDHAQGFLVQFAFYSSYLLFAAPITLFVVRHGYLRGVVAGLSVMALACLAFAGAQASRSFLAVLLSLLALSSGVTFLQIAGNAVMTVVAPAPDMAWRFTLLQGFNAIGTVLGPLIGAWFLLGRFTGSLVPNLPFLASAAALALLAAIFFGMRDALPVVRERSPAFGRLPVLLRDPAMLAGIGAIFAYVGAEVTVGTLAINYLMEPRSIGASPVAAGRLASLYWGGAMLGRFAGAGLLRSIAADRLLAGAAVGALILVAGGVGFAGVPGAVAVLAIGLCNAIMFPTIYMLALPTRQEDVPVAAMLLCMAVVGGAAIPLAAGFAADRFGVAHALLVPGLCYAGVLAFALRHRRTRAWL